MSYRQHQADAGGDIDTLVGPQIRDRNHLGYAMHVDAFTAPTDEEAGYAPGCTWRDTSGGNVYENRGSATSSSWNGNVTATGGTQASGGPIDVGLGTLGVNPAEATNLQLIPDTDDTGFVSIGNGTKDWDFDVFLGDAADYVEFNVGQKALKFAGATKINHRQGNPVAETTAATLAIADLLAGLITVTHAEGNNQNYTLDTGTLCDAAANLSNNEGFYWSLLNLSGTPATNTATVVAATGHTVVGHMVVGDQTPVGRFFTRKTATNTFITYRVA
jgi:hypothetical protein